jgi:hypothetical protein
MIWLADQPDKVDELLGAASGSKAAGIKPAAAVAGKRKAPADAAAAEAAQEQQQQPGKEQQAEQHLQQQQETAGPAVPTEQQQQQQPEVEPERQQVEPMEAEGQEAAAAEPARANEAAEGAAGATAEEAAGAVPAELGAPRHSVEQLVEASERLPNNHSKSAVEKAAAAGRVALGCGSCRYCTGGCPRCRQRLTTQLVRFYPSLCPSGSIIV